MLTTSQRAFLEERHYAILGTINADGSVQQTVVWYLLAGDEIRVSLGAQSVKTRNVARDPRVTLTVTTGPKYLTVTGQAVIEPPDDDLRLQLATRYLGAERAQEWLARPTTHERASLRMQLSRAYGQGV